MQGWLKVFTIVSRWWVILVFLDYQSRVSADLIYVIEGDETNRGSYIVIAGGAFTEPKTNSCAGN